MNANNKVSLVTGANGGIGKETARGLAQQGHHVIMVCRNPEKGREAQAQIKAESGNKAVDLLLADLASQQDIRRLADEVLNRYDRLDVLVNNAGVFLWRHSETEEGYETTFAVNHLAYFLLTNLLLDRLKASAPARIVNVSSDSHRGSTINFDDLDGRKKYSGNKAYGQSKLANVLFTYELARRLEGTGVTANALHPGVVSTNIGSGNPVGWIFKLGRPFFLSPEQGAATSLYLATSEEVEGVSGKYFVKQKEVRSTRASYDQEAAVRLWQRSLELTGLDA